MNCSPRVYVVSILLMMLMFWIGFKLADWLRSPGTPAKPECTCDVRAMPPPYAVTMEFENHDGKTVTCTLLQMVDDPKPVPKQIVEVRLKRGFLLDEYIYGFDWGREDGSTWVDDVKGGMRWFSCTPLDVRFIPVMVLPLSEADQTRKAYQDRWLKARQECPVHGKELSSTDQVIDNAGAAVGDNRGAEAPEE